MIQYVPQYTLKQVSKEGEMGVYDGDKGQLASFSCSFPLLLPLQSMVKRLVLQLRENFPLDQSWVTVLNFWFSSQ